MKYNTRFSSTNFNILIVSQYYHPEIIAPAFRIKETVDVLSSKNHKITVITAMPHRAKVGETEKIDRDRVRIIRIPIIKYRGKGKWDYIFHYLSFMIMAIFTSLFRIGTKPDIVMASSPPLFVGVAGYIISKLKSSRFVLDIRDIWPDSAVVAGQLNRDSLLYKYAKEVEQWLYKRAHLISCVAVPMAEYIASAVDREKVVVVYNGVPERYLIESSLNYENRQELFCKDKINIVYVGNMGYCQNLRMVIESAKHIKEEGINDIVFHLVGEGVERAMLEYMKTEYALDNVIISGPVNKDKAIEIICNSSALFLQLKDDGIMEKTIPSKVFDYMVGGKPILFGIQGEGRRILENIKGNIFFNPDSVESFTDALRNLKLNYKHLSEYARDNRIVVQKYYVREKIVYRLEEQIQKILSNKEVS